MAQDQVNKRINSGTSPGIQTVAKAQVNNVQVPDLPWHRPRLIVAPAQASKQELDHMDLTAVAGDLGKAAECDGRDDESGLAPLEAALEPLEAGRV